MADDDDREAMTNACIEAAEHVKRSGSVELQTAMRVLLYILAGEVIERARSAEIREVAEKGLIDG